MYIPTYILTYLLWAPPTCWRGLLSLLAEAYQCFSRDMCVPNMHVKVRAPPLPGFGRSHVFWRGIPCVCTYVNVSAKIKRGCVRMVHTSDGRVWSRPGIPPRMLERRDQERLSSHPIPRHLPFPPPPPPTPSAAALWIRFRVRQKPAGERVRARRGEIYGDHETGAWCRGA